MRGTKLDGQKLDDGKPRYDLIPPKALHEFVEVLTFGAQKYGPENWRKLEHPKRRYFAAALRHMFTWWRNQLHTGGHDIAERNDAESNRHHLAHAICCLMFILDLEL